MKSCVVGHAPSLEGTGMGALIDSCDVVIQMWSPCRFDRRDYGRCDVFMFSAHEYWKHTQAQKDVEQARADTFVCIVLPGEKRPTGHKNVDFLHQKWLARAREIRPNNPLNERLPLQLSRGTVAGLYALSRYPVVVFAGCDALWSDADHYTRAQARGKWGHDASVERVVLKEAAQAYESQMFNIGFLT